MVVMLLLSGAGSRLCAAYFSFAGSNALFGAPQPGQVGRIAYGRYGLQAGKQVLVRRVERNPATGDVVLTVWG